MPRKLQSGKLRDLPSNTTLRVLWAQHEWHRLVPAMQRVMIEVMPNHARSEPDLMEELCQRALIRMWSCSYVPENPIGWMTTVLKNLLLDSLKTAHSRKVEGFRDDEEPESGEEHPDERIERMQSLGRLREALRSLPDPMRRCLVLHDLHGRSAADIGRQFGLTEGAVKMRLHRARRLLGKIYRLTPAPPLNEQHLPTKKRGRAKNMTWLRVVSPPD